jgi:DNA polymerase III alpha subunit
MISPDLIIEAGRRLGGTSALIAPTLASLLPRKNEREFYSLGESMSVEPKLRQLYETDPQMREILDLAHKLETEN